MPAGGAAISIAFAGCAPGEAAQGISEQDVMIETPDGTANAYFAHPSKGAHAAVLIWPDIVSLRPAFKMMAKRLANDGYSALVINPYYRQTKEVLVEPGQTFRDPGIREKIIPFARALSQDTNRTDARAFVDWLDAQDAVDTSRKIGTTGYCMGGPNSPHLLIPEMNASYLIAIADNDDKRDPESKKRGFQCCWTVSGNRSL